MKYKVFLISIVFAFSIVSTVSASDPVSLRVKQGWNLITGHLGLNVNGIESSCTAEDIDEMLIYDPVNKQYCSEGSICWNSMVQNDPNYLKKTALKVDFNKKCRIYLNNMDTGNTYSLKAGQNLLAFSESMLGKNLNKIKGDCRIYRVYSFADGRNKWKVSSKGMEIKDRDLGKGVAVYVKEDCTLNTVPSTETNCGNRVDDDGDGLKDCKDPDCSSGPICTSSVVCSVKLRTLGSVDIFDSPRCQLLPKELYGSGPNDGYTTLTTGTNPGPYTLWARDVIATDRVVYFDSVVQASLPGLYAADFYINGYPHGIKIRTTYANTPPSMTNPPEVRLEYVDFFGIVRCGVELLSTNSVRIKSNSSCPIPLDGQIKKPGRLGASRLSDSRPYTIIKAPQKKITLNAGNSYTTHTGYNVELTSVGMTTSTVLASIKVTDPNSDIELFSLQAGQSYTFFGTSTYYGKVRVYVESISLPTNKATLIITIGRTGESALEITDKVANFIRISGAPKGKYNADFYIEEYWPPFFGQITSTTPAKMREIGYLYY